jgi:hypothetical protein
MTTFHPEVHQGSVFEAVVDVLDHVANMLGPKMLAESARGRHVMPLDGNHVKLETVTVPPTVQATESV